MEGLQPDEGKREGEKVGMTVPEQPGALKAMGGKHATGAHKGEVRVLAWSSRRDVWSENSGVGETVVCRRRCSEDGSGSPRRPCVGVWHAADWSTEVSLSQNYHSQ